ncbi:hypothetical protein Tco_0758561 [Tanacetum coccineum]
MKDSELASLFGKLKYEENLIDNIYETKKNKSRISTPPLSTAFISTSIVQVFQDSPDDEEDTRSCLAVQKKLTKLNAINVARKHKPELRPTKDFEAKYNKVKAKMALLSLSALASKAITVKNKAEENDAVSKEGARNGEWVKISVRKGFAAALAVLITEASQSRQHAVMSSSTVTYTSVYTDSELGRVFWGADEELSDGGSPRVIVYGYDGLPMQPVAPPSSDYVPGPKHPPSPDYVPGPEHPPSPVEVPYVPEPEYPEYLVPSDDEAPLEDQPLPIDATPTTLSLGYVTDFDPDKDPEEDPEEDHTDYPADGGDGVDEPSNDDHDDDTDDKDEYPFKDEDDDEEEDEHLALVDSFTVPVVDPVPPTRDTKAIETDESAPTPRSPQTKARIAEHAAAPTPPLPISSPPLPLPSPLTTSPTDAGTDIPEAEMPPQKRACFTTLAPRLEVRESSAAGVVRQPGPTLEVNLRRDRVMETGYGIIDAWDEIIEAMLEVAPTTLEGVNQRVIELATTVRQKTKEFQVRFEDVQDDRAYLRAQVNTLFKDRPYHRHTAIILDREAMYARMAWTGSEDRSAAIEAYVRTLEALVATLIAQTLSLQAQLTTTLRRIKTLEDRDPEP